MLPGGLLSTCQWHFEHQAENRTDLKLMRLRVTHLHCQHIRQLHVEELMVGVEDGAAGVGQHHCLGLLASNLHSTG